MEPHPVALTLHGNVDVRQVNLAFKVEGRIASLEVDEGDAVAAGAVVATLDRRYFDDELRLARAERDAQAATLARLEHGSRPEEIAEARALVVERQATVARANLYVKRLENLVKDNSVSRQECDDAEAAARVARAQLDSARQSLRLAEIGPRIEDITAARCSLPPRKPRSLAPNAGTRMPSSSPPVVASFSLAPAKSARSSSPVRSYSR